MTKRFACFGAAGAQGSPVVALAVRTGLDVRAVTRSAQGLNLMRNKFGSTADCVIADFEDVPSLVLHLEDVDAAFVHLPIARSPDEPQRFLGNVLKAARTINLPLLVFSTSGFASPRYRPSPLIDSNRAAAEAVRASGVPSIILQPTIYLENLRVPLFVPKLAAHGLLDYPPLPPTQRVVWTSQLDQAILAVAAMQAPHLAGQSYEIASSGSLTAPELAVELSRTLRRTVRSEAIRPDEFGQRVSAAINNPALAFLLGDMYAAAAELGDDGMVVDTDSVSQAFGVQLKTVQERIRDWSDA